MDFSDSEVYGITEEGSHGWGSPSVMSYLVGGGVALTAFVIIELLAKDPLMDVRLFLNYTFSVSKS